MNKCSQQRMRRKGKKSNAKRARETERKSLLCLDCDTYLMLGSVFYVFKFR